MSSAIKYHDCLCLYHKQYIMIEITNRSIPPYQSVCFIQTLWPDGTASRGSGSVVGANDVLTALHVVYDDSHGGWATQVLVSPGADIDQYSFSAPLGTYSATSWTGRTGNWDTNHNGLLSPDESEHDLALINLNVNLGALTGILNVSNQATDFQATLLGYPAVGTGLMEEHANAYSTLGYGYSLYEVDAGLGAGASGGPLLDYSNGIPTIRGVLSGGDEADTMSVYAGLFGGGNWAWYNQAIKANDYLLDGNEQRPVGPGVNSGSQYDDVFMEGRISLNSDNSGSFYGYSGRDVLYLNGSSTSYQRYIDSSSPDILHLDSTIAGGLKLSLKDINILDFSDKLLYVLDENQAQVARLYNAAFHRTPDTAGLEYWLNDNAHGVSAAGIANSFTQSSEFKSLFNAADNRDYVTQLYANILGRTGETSGIDYWLSDLANNQTRADVLLSFSDSAENQTITEGNSGFIQLVGHSEWV
ncbi:DUF4214 domain-containing protein [Pseudomonas sp. MAG002Y]|nr:DUF4214 domain-containing protein [Pseudomonas sp. MAG002Y]